MNKDFLDIYEELSILNEAKADTQKLIDFVGSEYADKFLAIKHRLKSPENDLYYWIKNKEPEELISTIDNLESTSTNKEIRDESKAGGILVAENEDWKVYHITTYEASQYYGRDTKWCITGIDNNGDTQWKDYHDNRGVEFYFFISKQNYDTRGAKSKYALAVWPKKKAYEIYDQQDNIVNLQKVSFMKKLNIPGVELSSLRPFVVPGEVRCEYCNDDIYICDGESYKTEDNDTKYYHELCYYKKYKPEALENLTCLDARIPGVARVDQLYKPYDEALAYIKELASKVQPWHKDNIYLNWTFAEPRKSIISIFKGKIEYSNNKEVENLFKFI